MRAMNQNRKTVVQEIPTRTQLEEELNRERYQSRFFRTLRSTVYGLITVAAAAVLVATLWLPVLRIYGSSMTPTLSEGDIVVSVKTTEFQPGDIVSFYFNNKILVKRVIAGRRKEYALCSVGSPRSAECKAVYGSGSAQRGRNLSSPHTG